MKILAPIEGLLDWRVEEGSFVSDGAVLGWLAGPGRCGLVALLAGASGRVSWCRSSALESITAGEPAVLIDGDEDELQSCQTAEQHAARQAIATLEREVAQLERDELAHSLGVQLLRPQRLKVQARLATLRAISR